MEIRQLGYFCVLAEQLHVTKAALLLNVAQPALSHQIKQLEEELGTQGGAQQPARTLNRRG